jgi:hypothetical protein
VERDQTFPDLAALFPTETWTMTWEGTLSRDAISTAVDGPSVREGEIRVDGSGLHVVDPAQPFCRAGVETFDIVQLRGCDPSIGNLDCPTGYRCFVHPESEVESLGARSVPHVVSALHRGLGGERSGPAARSFASSRAR